MAILYHTKLRVIARLLVSYCFRVNKKGQIQSSCE